VPADARRVAVAALQEGADAVLVDVAGPTPFPVEGPALHAVAEGRPWVPPQRDPEVVAEVAALAAGVVGLLSHALAAGSGDEYDLLVSVTAGPGTDGLEAARRFGAQLGASPVLQDRCPRGVAVAVESVG
jgi:hypothetical protein